MRRIISISLLRIILLDREAKIVFANMASPSNSETAKTLTALKGM